LKIPFVEVGKFRTFKVCKKAHLTDEDEALWLSNFLDAELEIVKQTNDAKEHVLLTGDENEDPQTPLRLLSIVFALCLLTCLFSNPTPPDLVPCSGYCNLTTKDPCQQMTAPVMKITHKDHTLFFCNGRHLMRFLVEHYGKQGSTTKKKKHNSGGK